MKQITIITKNYHGLTADLASALDGNEINIETLDAKKLDDIGVITLVVDQYKRALHALNNAGWNPIKKDTRLVRVADELGADPIDKARDLVKDELLSIAPAV